MSSIPEDDSTCTRPSNVQVLTDVSYIRCEPKGRVHYRKKDLESEHAVIVDVGGSVLACKGLVFGKGLQGRPTSWERIQADLQGLPQEGGAVQRYLEGFSGWFWFVHIRRSVDGTLWAATGTDSMGMIPNFNLVDKGGECFVVSPHHRLVEMDDKADSGNITNMRSVVLVSPRVVSTWRQGSCHLDMALARTWTCLTTCAQSDFGSSDGGSVSGDEASGDGASGDGASGARASGACGGGHSKFTQLRDLLIQAVARCMHGNSKMGVLFSGGLDSSTLATICLILGGKSHSSISTCDHQQDGVEVLCTGYTVGFHDVGRVHPGDIEAAAAVAEEFGRKFGWKSTLVDLRQSEDLLRTVAPLVVDFNVVKAGVGMTMLGACQAAAADKTRVVLSGLGSEEVFAGYYRHLNAIKTGASPRELQTERVAGLAQMYHRDLQRDFAISSSTGVTILYPFLDQDLLTFVLASAHSLYSEAFQMEPDLDPAKAILRALAQDLGVPKSVWTRKKRAAQYGSRFHYCLQTLAKTYDAQSVNCTGYPQARLGNYVMSMPGASHSTLALLCTSGKDSLQAYNYFLKTCCKFVCVIGPSEHTNPHSHRVAATFAATTGLPLLECTVDLEWNAPMKGSRGNPIQYCGDSLVEALREACTYGVGGVVSGHVCNLSQWMGLIKACDTVSLRPYAPLWRTNPSSKVIQLMLADGCQLEVSKAPPGSGIGIGTSISSTAEAEDVIDRLGRWMRTQSLPENGLPEATATANDDPETCPEISKEERGQETSASYSVPGMVSEPDGEPQGIFDGDSMLFDLAIVRSPFISTKP